MDWIGLNADVERILNQALHAGSQRLHQGRDHPPHGRQPEHRRLLQHVADAARRPPTHAVQADGTIGQLVNDWDTAWAVRANAWANRKHHQHRLRQQIRSGRGRSTTPCSTRARTSWRRDLPQVRPLAVRSGW